MSAEPATALPSSSFLRIFATFYRALLVARRHFVAPRKLYQEPRDDDNDGSSRRVLSLHPNQVLRRDFCERDDDLATHGERDRSDARRKTDRHAHSRDYVTRYKKQVTHTYTQQEKRARERDAKGHPPGATPESVLSFYYTLLRLPSLLSSTIFLSANVTTLRKRRSPESERGRDEGEIPPPPSSFGERLPTPGDLARRKRNRSAAILVRDSRHLPCQLYQLVVVVVQHGCEVPFLFPFLSHARVVLSHPFQCPSILSLPALSSSTVIIPSESPIPSSRTAQDSRRLSLTRTRQSPLARVRHLKEFRYTPIVPGSRHSREPHSGSFPLTVRSFSPVLVPRYVPPRDEKRRQ